MEASLTSQFVTWQNFNIGNIQKEFTSSKLQTNLMDSFRSVGILFVKIVVSLSGVSPNILKTAATVLIILIFQED